MPRSPLMVIYLTVFVDLIGFGIIIPLLPYYAQALGAGPTFLGLMIASYSLMQFLFAPILGRMSDRFGRRPVILVSLVGSTLSYLIFALADSLPLLLLSRVLGGIAGANLPVAQAYVADLTPPQQRVKAMSLIGAAFGIGFIVGPAIGGFLGVYGLSAPGFGAATLSMANLVLAFIFLRESLTVSLRSERKNLPQRRGGLLNGFRRPVVGTLLLIFFVVNFAFSSVPVAYPLLGIALFKLGPSEMAFIFTYIGLIQVFIQVGVLGKMARRWGDEMLLATGTLLIAATLLATAFSVDIVMFIFVSGLMAIGIAIATTVVPSMVSKVSAANEQGSMMGLTQSAGGLARVPGPLISGLISEYLGLATPLILASVLMFAGFGLAIRVLASSASKSTTK